MSEWHYLHLWWWEHDDEAQLQSMKIFRINWRLLKLHRELCGTGARAVAIRLLCEKLDSSKFFSQDAKEEKSRATRIFRTGDGEEMGFAPSEMRFTEVSGEGVLLVTLDTGPGFWGVHLDRQNDSHRSFWLLWLGLTVKKANVISNYVLQDICCDMLG